MNCGFETGDFSQWKTEPLAGGHLSTNGEQPHSGSWQASFGSGPPGDVISQTLSGLKHRTNYTLTFWLANTSPDPGTSFTASIRHTAKGTVRALKLADSPAFAYREYRCTFRTRSSGRPIISFAGSNIPDTWHLDDVVVTRTGQ